MAARAMWKGVIQLGETEIGVKLYAALDDRDVHFRTLERKKHTPVEQRMVKPDSDEPVPYDQIKKGFLSDGEYVMLEKDELEELAPKQSRDIAIERFVEDEKLGAEWFVRPYYLGPDDSAERYFALARALTETKREGIAHWVMRGIEYSGVLRAVGDHLMLMTLRHQDEVVSVKDLALPSGREHGDKEAKMAEQLVLAYEDEFDPSAYKNEHRDRVLELIEAKAKGHTLKLKPVRTKKAEPSLADALEKSLAGLKGGPAKAKKEPASGRATKKKERVVA